MEWKVNEQTGKKEFDFNAELTYVASEAKTSETSGKEFRNCSVKLPNNNIVFGIMNEKNHDYGVSVGTKYLCRAIQVNDEDPNDLLIVVSHLAASEKATVSALEDAFGVSVVETKEENATIKDELPVGG